MINIQQSKEGHGPSLNAGRRSKLHRIGFGFRLKGRSNRGCRRLPAKAASAKRQMEETEKWMSTVREMKRKNGFVPL